MVYASFIRIGELSTTTLVHALVGHCKASYWHTVRDGSGQYCVRDRAPHLKRTREWAKLSLIGTTYELASMALFALRRSFK